jgi:hypothetical protein
MGIDVAALALPFVPAVGAVFTKGAKAAEGGAFTVRRFVPRSELKQLKQEGMVFDASKGSGIPTTTRNFAPATQDIARTKTGARNAEFYVDLDVSGVARGPTTITRSGLPEYPIQGDLVPEMILGFGRVPK